MILKIKAKIYQYTGIYLAQKEEDAHIASIQQIEEFEGMSSENTEGLMRGLWQAEHGFYSRFLIDKNLIIRFIKRFYYQLTKDLGL